MADAGLSVTFAGPLVTLQDAGRPGNMRYGVAASGPMDKISFDAANAALGNAAGATAIEVSLGGLMLQCKKGQVTVAIAGGDFIVDHAGQKKGSWTILTLRSEDRLSIRAGKTGSWAYLAFAGEICSEQWLESTSTHSTSGFGGGPVLTGQRLLVENAVVREDREGDIAAPGFLSEGPVSVVMGPQDGRFKPSSIDEFTTATFQVTDGYDRMGMRLNGPELKLDGALSIPSEPVVRGSVQVAGDGVATVLLADHQTTGGYPKIATVASFEIARLVQLRSGNDIKFAAIDTQTAIERTRQFDEERQKYIGEISTARGTLEQRLMRGNLIHGYSED